MAVHFENGPDCGSIIGRASIDEPEIAPRAAEYPLGHGYANRATAAIIDIATAIARRTLWATVGA
ncbi:hypothetical protein [Salinibacterium sp. ZJ450]|uniref:hypothetical protein n=1 Tax=Salinibacterium sp. ZJ450 TaxID=2708338 RepID=UPI00141D8DFD|nr:hypothetical protein [Salinibacterium sp. ZJ450]